MAKDEFPEHIASTLAYVFLFFSGVLLLTTQPYSAKKTIRVNALQSILLTLAFLGIWFACVLLSRIAGPFLVYLLNTVMTTSLLTFLGVWFYSMFKAYNRFPVEIPLLSKLAEKFASGN